MSLDGRSPEDIRKIIGPDRKHCLDNRGGECQQSYEYQKIVCCDRVLYGGRNLEPKCKNFSLKQDFDIKSRSLKHICPRKVEYKDCKHRKKAVCGIVLFGGRAPDEDCKSYAPRIRSGSLKGVMRLEEVSEDGN